MIEALALAEIKALDAGSKFDSHFRGEQIPTLREAFAFLQHTNLLLFVELKAPWRYPGLEAMIVTLIREYGLVDRVQVRSFFHNALHTIYGLDPEISLSELWADRLPSDAEVNFRTINALYSLYTRADIARIHQRGQQATAWVVNDLDVARSLAEAGIDGLTSDFPDRLLSLSLGGPGGKE
jgi:glycerophosphoryl diester phosphodiesterase